MCYTKLKDLTKDRPTKCFTNMSHAMTLFMLFCEEIRIYIHVKQIMTGHFFTT